MNDSLPRIAEPERKVFTLPGGATMAFRLIPAGSFRMGSRGGSYDEQPRHLVQIKEPFWLAETPVTQAQFAEWTTATKVGHENKWSGHPDHPAENMDWRQANSCCAWLSQVIPTVPGNKLPPGYDLFCLPTEAEWEYACRAGTETDYHTGDGEAALAEAGRFGQDYEAGTRPVRLGAKNAWGLYDLHGHVWQWCHDVYDGDAYRQRVDGEADAGADIRKVDWVAGLSVLNDSADDRGRVVRGGSWGFTAWGCRSASRIGGGPMSAAGSGASVPVWSVVRQARAEPESRCRRRRHPERRESEAEGRGRRRTEPVVPERTMATISRRPGLPAKPVKNFSLHPPPDPFHLLTGVVGKPLIIMRFRLFQYPLPAPPELDELNAYLGSQRVAAVTHHLIPTAGGGMLVFVVETAGVAAAKPSPQSGPKVDYRELLNAGDFVRFTRLRDERKKWAEAEGLPVYTVFTNAQLAALARGTFTTMSDLTQVEGLGQARVEKYGARLLALLNPAATPEADP